MSLSFAQWALMFTLVILQVAIIILMVRRKFQAKFPIFLNFVIFGAVTLVLEILMLWFPKWYPANAYSYVYWTIQALGVLLTFAVIREVFVQVLKPYSALVDLGKLLFRWAVLFLALASVLIALTASGTAAKRICYVIDVLERSAELMSCGLLLLFVSFEKRLGLPWRIPASCIIVGLGVNSALTLITSFLRTHFPGWDAQLDMVASVFCVVLYAGWCLSFALPQPARKTVEDSPGRLIFQRWNEVLMATPLVSRQSSIVAMAPIESFLPGVERTVERVMARKMMN